MRAVLLRYLSLFAVCQAFVCDFRANAAPASKPAKAQISQHGQQALAHYYGLNAPQDFYKAYRHARNGAVTGDASALVVEALCLGRGRGVAQDMAGAMKALAGLLAKDEPLACAAAAVLLGQGVAEGGEYPPIFVEEFRAELAEMPRYDPATRRRWVQAALAGLKKRLDKDPVACVVAGQLLSWGVAVPKNEARATELFLRAWKMGCSDAGNQLGLIYQEGEPGIRDHAKALAWFLKADAAGHAVAKCNRAVFTAWSPTDEGQQAEREALLRAAAEAGFPDAMEQLGFSYWTSKDARQGRAQARVWFEKAAPSGRRESIAALGKLLCDHPADAEERRRGLRLQRQAIARASETAAYDMSGRFLWGEADVPAKPELGFLLATFAAASGVKDAWSMVGAAYAHGRGVAQSDEQALTAFRKGIELGSAECLYYLGAFHADPSRGDFRAAYREYARGAEAGSTNAMREAGRCLLVGNGVAKDEAAGLAWINKAAGRDDRLAMTYLGDACLLGLGMKADPARAVELYREAAAQGESSAMACLARCFRDGQGISSDQEEAVVWMRRSAEAGNRDGAVMLAQHLLQGRGVPVDLDEAWKWTQTAAALGQPEACTMVGDFHREGRVGPASASEAFRWYEKAAQLGHPRGTNNLGYSYQTGAGVKADAFQAFELYNKAVALGDPTALINLADCFEQGIGVPIDLTKALQLREQHQKMTAK